MEEKNRRLMKMLVNRNNPGGGGDEDEDDDEDESGNRSGAETRQDELGENGGLGGVGGEMNNENEMMNNGEGNNENRALLFDLNGSAAAMKKKKRRAPDPDRDKYIQEPQYVTKRTSSGRLVKMKIITDYDYTSDQEQEAAKKKRREADEDGVEGIQRKHRKGRHHDEEDEDEEGGGGGGRLDSPLSDMSGSEASGDDSSSDDEDFMGNKRKSPKRYRTTPAVTRSRGRPVKPMTVSGLLNRAQMNNNNSSSNSNNKTFVDDDDDEEVVTGRSRSRYIDSDSDEELKDLSKYNHTNHVQPSNSSDAASGARAPLTFEQYVKKLTGSYTLKSSGDGAAGTADSTSTIGHGDSQRLWFLFRHAGLHLHQSGARSVDRHGKRCKQQ